MTDRQRRPRRVIGPVEKAYRAWIRGLGELGPRQLAMVAQIYALAQQLDQGRDGELPLSAMGTVSRELRMCAADIRDAKALGGTAPPEPADTVDEVRQRREERKRRRASVAVVEQVEQE